RLPAGVQLFSMFLAHPELLDLVAEILGSAPKLAGHLAQTPTLLDAVLSPDFHRGLPDRNALAADLADTLARAGDFQDVLDLSRAWARDRRFQVGVQVMRGRIAARESGIMLSDLAEVLMAALLPNVETEFAATSGRIAGAEFAIVALGKLGARALTSGSDLDLVFLYDAPADAVSDGARPLPAATYFARLGQRFLAALSAPTAEGALFEVDMRLRPSGASGPIATSLPAFQQYHRDKAWTWERMALTRARVVAAGDAFRQRVEDELRAILTARRDPEALLRDVAEMRARIEREKSSANPWRVKYVRGGLLDLEFLAQYLILCHAADHPDLLTGDTAEAFTRLERAGILDPALADRLRDAVRLAASRRSCASVIPTTLMKPPRPTP
ncbi:MAG: glutamine-synthetase adenylyltransferase, partial [Proteobacteria bacterium]|nr:glutamine-synthetase adenylyltransferase [Pseudomonadota bacterium]